MWSVNLLLILITQTRERYIEQERCGEILCFSKQALIKNKGSEERTLLVHITQTHKSPVIFILLWSNQSPQSMLFFRGIFVLHESRALLRCLFTMASSFRNTRHSGQTLIQPHCPAVTQILARTRRDLPKYLKLLSRVYGLFAFSEGKESL